MKSRRRLFFDMKAASGFFRFFHHFFYCQILSPNWTLELAAAVLFVFLDCYFGDFLQFNRILGSHPALAYLVEECLLQLFTALSVAKLLCPCSSEPPISKKHETWSIFLATRFRPSKGERTRNRWARKMLFDKFAFFQGKNGFYARWRCLRKSAEKNTYFWLSTRFLFELTYLNQSKRCILPSFIKQRPL